MQIESTNGSYRDLDVQALAIAVFKDEKADDGFLKDLDSITGGVIKSVIDSEELKGKEGETVYLHLAGNSSIKAQRLLLVGSWRARRVHTGAGGTDGRNRDSGRCARRALSQLRLCPGLLVIRNRSLRWLSKAP